LIEGLKSQSLIKDAQEKSERLEDNIKMDPRVQYCEVASGFCFRIVFNGQLWYYSGIASTDSSTKVSLT
jgi:hypothetical protein